MIRNPIAGWWQRLEINLGSRPGSVGCGGGGPGGGRGDTSVALPAHRCGCFSSCLSAGWSACLSGCVSDSWVGCLTSRWTACPALCPSLYTRPGLQKCIRGYRVTQVLPGQTGAGMLGDQRCDRGTDGRMDRRRGHPVLSGGKGLTAEGQ